jgi:hypothetical protein
MQRPDCKLCNPEVGETAHRSGRCAPMTGRRFGALIVEELACIAPRCWKCLCDCGTTSIVEGGNLRRKVNGTRSCGRCESSAGVPRYKDMMRAKKEAGDGI